MTDDERYEHLLHRARALPLPILRRLVERGELEAEQARWAFDDEPMPGDRTRPGPAPVRDSRSEAMW